MVSAGVILMDFAGFKVCPRQRLGTRNVIRAASTPSERGMGPLPACERANPARPWSFCITSFICPKK